MENDKSAEEDPFLSYLLSLREIEEKGYTIIEPPKLPTGLGADFESLGITREYTKPSLDGIKKKMGKKFIVDWGGPGPTKEGVVVGISPDGHMVVKDYKKYTPEKK